MDVDVRTLRDGGELEQAFELARESFDIEPGERDRWVAHTDAGRTIGAFLDGQLVAMGTVLGLGQHFGGRAVPMGGVASVAVASEHRGRGYGPAVVQAMLPAMRERGEVISTLSPATTRLYRGLGWEVAGVHGERRVPTRSLLLLPAGTVGIRRATLDDVPAVKACHGRAAPAVDGFLDRSDAYWSYRLVSRWDRVYVSVVDAEDGEIDGYVVWRNVPSPTWGHRIHVEEVVALHPDAMIALWRMIGSSSPQVPEVSWNGPPEDPLLLLLPEQDIQYRGHLRWMLRLVDAAGAVAARGFPVGVELELDLEVRDRFCPWNDGRWRLVVTNGRGRLEEGGVGTVELGIGALSSLWAGYASARTLAATGLLAGGRPAHLAMLDAAFAGPTPWMPDHF